MSLYQQWTALAETERTQEESDAFWSAYFDKETEAYRKILSENSGSLKGTPAELAARFGMESIEVAGFLDGINTSLTEACDLEQLTETSALDLSIDFEKLYYNMRNAKAPWLYELPEWDGVLTEEKRRAITKRFHEEHIYHAPAAVGRNDPCPCGSGKKYKKCCGAAKA